MPSSSTVLDVCASGALVATVATLIVLSPGGATRALAGPCDAPVTNPIACENTKPGSSDWELSGSMDRSILGFTTDISVEPRRNRLFQGQDRCDRLHARHLPHGLLRRNGCSQDRDILPSAALPQTQPGCLTDSATGLLDCGNWAVSAAWSVPADADLRHLLREAHSPGHAGSESRLLHRPRRRGSARISCSRPRTRPGRLITTTGETPSTLRAMPLRRAYKASYNRPFMTRESSGGRELGLQRRVPDGAMAGGERLRRQLLHRSRQRPSGRRDPRAQGVPLSRPRRVLVGAHSAPRWKRPARRGSISPSSAATKCSGRPAGRTASMARTRLTARSSATRRRHAGAKIDPLPNVWTGTWRDPRFSATRGRRTPRECADRHDLHGQRGTPTQSIRVSEPYGKMRFWRNTTLADLTPGQEASLPTASPGIRVGRGSRQRIHGLRGSSTCPRRPSACQSKLLDYSSTYGPGYATHSLTLYRHESGALVFGAGTIQWSWGLDGHHDWGHRLPDVRMQQATVNLLADMGVQPVTLQVDLLPASPSLDTIAPASIDHLPGRRRRRHRRRDSQHHWHRERRGWRNRGRR